METIKYLPSILANIKELQVLMTANDSENLSLNMAVEELYKDQFITTTEIALQRYESMLGITPKGTDTSDDRRFRILAVYNKRLPYTKTILKEYLIILCGQDGYKLMMDYNHNVLKVQIALTAKSMYDTVKHYLEGIVPMNLFIDLTLLYNQYKMLHQYTYNQLSRYTNKQLREEVIT